MLDEFIEYLNAQIGQPYIWGGQGLKLTPSDYESIIKKKESDSTDRKNAINFCKKRFAAGAKELKAFDCSGLGMYFIQNLHKLSPTDLNANGMMGKCTLISKNALKKGCFVFKRYKTGTKRAYHVGYIVDDSLSVVESRGRKYGVVKRPLSQGGWNTYGIPSWFQKEIVKEDVIFARNLKKGCKGADVSELQKLLNAKGDNLQVDGEFGSKTLAAVKAFQKLKKLKVDGIAGIKTITALGGVWRG